MLTVLQGTRADAYRLRVNYAGALYHLINRGNYRRDVFASDGAARSFLATVDEVCRRYGWRVHAYVVMKNHYHLAVETPQANLSEGMHWLQSTYATRFNRFRRERGHLFQGRYQAILVEGTDALLRLCDYIHLNPVRAGVLSPEEVMKYPWSSLARFIQGPRPPWLLPNEWLEKANCTDTREGWQRYLESLIALARDPGEQLRLGFDDLSRGWAIGSHGWRVALAKEYAAHALAPGLVREERRGVLEAQWEELLGVELAICGKTSADLNEAPSADPWKIALGHRLRQKGSVPYQWLAARLKLGNPECLRVAIRRYALRVPA